MPAHFLNVFFKLLYNDLAWSYDLVARAVSMGLWQSWVASVAADIHHSPVLETGYGPGHLIAELRENGYEVYGVDASFRMGVLASRNNNLVRNNVLLNGYAKFLPFPKHLFRTIVATFPSNYILERETWLEFRRVLHPKGCVFWLPAAWITSTALPYRFAAWLFRITHQVPGDHPAQNTTRFEMLEELGFNVTQEFRPLEKSVVWIVKATIDTQV